MLYSVCSQHGCNVDFYALRRTFDFDQLELGKHCSAQTLFCFAWVCLFFLICICMGTCPENPTVDFLGSSLHVERRRMHSPMILPTKSEAAACCTVVVQCVFSIRAQCGYVCYVQDFWLRAARAQKTMLCSLCSVSAFSA